MNTHDIRRYCFQDIAGTISSVNDGDPVRLLVNMFGGLPFVSTSNPPPILRGGLIANDDSASQPQSDTPHIITG